MKDITWKCHVCGAERPDERISVFIRNVGLKMGFEEDEDARENIRYCNDRPDCIEGAKTTTFFKDK